MSEFINIVTATFIGGRRDKVFITLIIISALAFSFIVFAVSPLSMRQPREVAVNLSLSVISLISLVLSIFLGVTQVYRDIDRKFVHTVLSLPISRERYILGKYIGLCAIITVGVLIMTIFSTLFIWISDHIYKPNVLMSWPSYFFSIYSDFLSLLVVAAISMLFSTISTSIFMPLFATIGIYIIGYITQTVYDYVTSPGALTLPPFIVYISRVVYFVFPNFTIYDIKYKAIYGLSVDYLNLLGVTAYTILYIVIIIGMALSIFRKREML